jgi:hypothetical protein
MSIKISNVQECAKRSPKDNLCIDLLGQHNVVVVLLDFVILSLEL